jgi:glycosyltransferase involved in cell wall biosynthesis
MEARFRIAIVTSIHADFDVRVWKHATAVAQAGHEVHLVCPWNVPPGEVRDGVIFHPFRRIETRLRRTWQIPARVLPQVLRLAPKVDLIHFHDFDLLPLLAPLSAYRPLVYDVHENYPEEMLFKDWVPAPFRALLSSTVRLGQLALARLVGNIVLVVPSQESDFPSRSIRRVCIPNYASRRLMDGARDDYDQRPDAVIYTGLQYESNGSALLLDIAEEVHKVAPRVRFLISDRFPLPQEEHRRRYLEQVERRGLGGAIELMPRVPPHDLMSLLNRATIGISPTLRVPRHERALPTKIFEYMAAGLPVVSSDLPSQRQIIEESEGGLLAQPEDAQSFVRAILTLVADREQARRLGQNGQRALLTSYSWESQMPKLLDFYEGILASRS